MPAKGQGTTCKSRESFDFYVGSAIDLDNRRSSRVIGDSEGPILLSGLRESGPRRQKH